MKEQKEKEGLLEKLEKLKGKNTTLSEQLKTANKKLDAVSEKKQED